MAAWTPPGAPTPLALPANLPATWQAASSLIRATAPTGAVPDVSAEPLVDHDDLGSFKLAKRAEEHATGRYLLAHLLAKPADPADRAPLDPATLTVVRDKHRAPRLARAGPAEASRTMLGAPLPAFTIAHAHPVAACLIAPALDFVVPIVGLDLEPLDEERRPGLIDFMSPADEAAVLHEAWAADDPNTPPHERPGLLLALRCWTAREAIMKAARLGMALHPHRIDASPLIERARMSDPDDPDTLLTARVEVINGPAFAVTSWIADLAGHPTVLAVATDVATGAFDAQPTD